jgi:hypothetical protein
MALTDEQKAVLTKLATGLRKFQEVAGRAAAAAELALTADDEKMAESLVEPVLEELDAVMAELEEATG